MKKGRIRSAESVEPAMLDTDTVEYAGFSFDDSDGRGRSKS